MEKPGEKKRLEQNVIIKVGEGNDSYIVATHFPCSCLPPRMCLTISTSNNVIEKKQQQVRVLPREKYSVFFIDKEGGKDSKSKTDMIFRCKNIQQQFRYFCVYGTKGMTVEEALRRDGRFLDGLTNFTLSDNRTGDVTNCTEIVDNLDGRKFQIRLPRKGKTKATNPSQVVQEQDSTQQTSQEEENASASPKVQNIEVTKVLENAAKNGVSVKKTLKLKRENFGKIQNSFSEVHTVRGLLDLSKSICLLMIEENNNSGLTELKKTKMNNWVNYLTITAEFSFESKGKPGMKYQATLVSGTHDLDFVLLKLIQLPGQPEVEEIPPGLLKIFGPVPLPVYDGGACIIGHPAGGVKKMDVTCIIRKEDREQAVEQNLASCEPFIVCSTNYQIKMNPYADIHVTYNSFMYHGSSGSPVFDASGRVVFGIHTRGFTYGFQRHETSVIEYAHPLLTIFEKFVINLKESGNDQMLEKVKEAVTKNKHLKKILVDLFLLDEPMEED
uniref:Serine protease n=1 Tax=Poecilia mexicana TaxID=48701 RepID=A0A3B3X8G9_9TELE